MDERTADAPVAVDERVDRLELGVRDGRLGDGRQVVAGHEGDEVLEQRADEVLGRRHEGGVRRVAEPPADPVLLLADAPGPRALVARHQRRVDREQVLGRDRSRSRSAIAIASSIAETFAATVRALPLAARGSISARARLSEETS